MRHEQGYNISKIQAGVSYFDTTFAVHTKNRWPQLNPHFFKFNFFLIKMTFKKILKIGHFVDEKILYYLRNSAPQTDKLWTRKSQNTINIEQVGFLKLEKMGSVLFSYKSIRIIDIWVFIITWYRLSNGLSKFKI